MSVWSNLKRIFRRLIYGNKPLQFPIYCKLHGVKKSTRQGSLAQSHEEDGLQLVHVPLQDYPHNVYAYSIPLNRVLGYLDKELAEQLVAEFGVDGMDDITVRAVGIFAAGHHDEITISGINDLDVMYGKTIVKGDGNYGLHGAFVKKLSDFDICELHALVLL